MHTRNKVPFQYNSKQEFQSKLVEWIGDILYDFLPENGYEVRDEQIFTAYQIADAICGKQAHLAEAGLGTGKTFAYLLSAIPYARFIGKPVIIASATTALQEQLAGETGDINKLSKVLGLEVDARMAKDPNQYVCEVRAGENVDYLEENADMIAEWLTNTLHGERSEIPTISDKDWKQIKWNESLACDTCAVRGYCKMVKAREYYRQTSDLLIVDHATFFHDLWTREARQLAGQTPILPEYSAVIFDEGHKVLMPAMLEAGEYINREEIITMIRDLDELQGARDSLLKMVELVKKGAYVFFKNLKESVEVVPQEQRLAVKRTQELLKACATFYKTLEHLLTEMQIEQELYTEALTPTQIQAYESQIEKVMWALNAYYKDHTGEMVTWIERKDSSFWVVPRNIGERLNKQLIKKGIPVILTSATLSNQGNFDYMIRKLGLNNPSTSTVGSPFDLENQVTIYLDTEDNKESKINKLIKVLEENGGRALVLAHSLNEVKKIRKALENHVFPFEMIWEDQGERGYLVRQFREKETSVLVGAHLWEGIDVPGEALTLLVVWELPKVVKEPLMEVQRKEAMEQGLNPVEAVDYPDMALRLKQGCGRLIRTETDYGKIVLLEEVKGTNYEKHVLGALPKGAKIYTLGD